MAKYGVCVCVYLYVVLFLSLASLRVFIPHTPLIHSLQNKNLNPNVTSLVLPGLHGGVFFSLLDF